MASSGSSALIPRHLRVVGGLSLLWNAFGAFDYLMTQLQVAAYMGQFSADVAVFSAVIWLITAGLFVYARQMTRTGVLQ